MLRTFVFDYGQFNKKFASEIPPYSPDLAPSGYQLFGLLKDVDLSWTKQ